MVLQDSPISPFQISIFCHAQQQQRMTKSRAMRELGLSAGYTEKDLKSAYRKRSLETHPDKGGSNEEFVKVAEAYEFLSSGGTSETGGSNVAMIDDGDNNRSCG